MIKRNPIVFSLLGELLKRTERYAVYGTGLRAIELLDFLVDRDLPLPILFLDDLAKNEMFAGIPVKKPDEVCHESYEFILLATDVFQEAMERRIVDLFGSAQRVLNIYIKEAPVRLTNENYSADLAIKDMMFSQNKVPYVRGKKIRIAFLFQVASFWPSWESVWNTLRSDDRYDVQMLLYDRVVREAVQMNSARAFLESRNIDYIDADDYDWDTQRPHIVFLQSPYDKFHRPPYLRVDRLKARGIRVAYIPYGMPINDAPDGRFCDMALGRMIGCPWRVYTLSTQARREFFMHSPYGGFHVRATGHPKFDGLLDPAAMPLEPEVRKKAGGRKMVLWKLHFPKYLTLPNGRRGVVTPDLDEYLDFVEQIKKYPDLFFIFMPHPKLRDSGAWDEERVDRLLKKASALDNVFMYEFDEYRPPVLHSDYIMLDRSAVMVEAGVSGVPVLYLKSDVYVEPQPQSIKPLVDSYYHGSTCADMVGFIEQCRAGNDPKKEVRHAAFKQCVPYFDGQCGPRIVEDLYNSLEAETVKE